MSHLPRFLLEEDNFDRGEYRMSYLDPQNSLAPNLALSPFI